MVSLESARELSSERATVRETVFNAPLLRGAASPLSMPVLYWLPDAVCRTTGLRWPSARRHSGDGGWWPGVLTSMLAARRLGPRADERRLGAWPSAPPVARLLPGAKGGVGFLAFYIVCGLLATLGYGLVHLGSYDAAGRGVRRGVRPDRRGDSACWARDGRLRPLTDRRFLTHGGGDLMAVNAVIGLIGFAPGVEGARIAWEAHAFGFLVGAPADRPAGAACSARGRTAFASPARSARSSRLKRLAGPSAAGRSL